jgi:hypothetical protein
MTENQFDSITKWQKKTFPTATVLSKLHHMERETRELILAVSEEDHLIDHAKIRAVKMEFADNFLLLFGAASAYGMSFSDIVDAINEKMRINVSRSWGQPNEQGFQEHVKPHP